MCEVAEGSERAGGSGARDEHADRVTAARRADALERLADENRFLWGMDDGSLSPEMSAAMLQMAASGGTTDIVATPHADTDYELQPELIAERRAELQGLAADGIRIDSGCGDARYCYASGTKLAAARKFSDEMPARSMVHFLASDAHDLDRRSPRLDQVRAHDAGRYGEDYAVALLHTHPRAATGDAGSRPALVSILAVTGGGRVVYSCSHGSTEICIDIGRERGGGLWRE